MLEQAIHDALLADSTILGLVVDRCRPLIGTQDDIQPRIAYQVQSDETEMTFGGPSGYFTATVEVDCIGDTAKQCATLSSNVKRVLDGFSGSTGGCFLCPSTLRDSSDVEEAFIIGTEVPVFVRTLTFEVFYRLTS